MNGRKHYLIYKITNLVNGKIYIGKHKTDNPDDGYLGSGKLLWKAFDKYGIENFKKEILFDFETEEEMNSKEAELVNESFVAREDTYNLTLGGNGGWNFINENRDKIAPCGFRWFHLHATEEQKRICDKNRKRVLESFSEERKNEICQKISSNLKKHYENHQAHFLGKHHTSLSKAKIGKANSIHQQGSGNSNFGKHWWMNPETGESHSFFDTDVPDGWIRGRSPTH